VHFAQKIHLLLYGFVTINRVKDYSLWYNFYQSPSSAMTGKSNLKPQQRV